MHKLVWKDVLHNKRHEEKSRIAPNVTVYAAVSRCVNSKQFLEKKVTKLYECLKNKKICYNKKYDMEKIVFETVNDCEIEKETYYERLENTRDKRFRN